MGDPCNPSQYSWTGLSCSYDSNVNSTILAVNLSFSGLTGEIISSFTKFRAIKSLDLANNSLQGTIPSFLALISTLQVLNLSGNNFTGAIPEALLNKANAGLLVFKYDNKTTLDNTTNTCTGNTSCGAPVPSPINNTPKNNSKISTPIIIVIAVASFILLVVLILLIFVLIVCRKPKVEDPHNAPGVQVVEVFRRPNVDHENHRLQAKSPQITYLQLENYTSKFSRVIGKGGFGVVYHGYLEDATEVAVKVLSDTSTQGSREFLAEVRSLTKVHHRNLVSLIAYCMEEGHLALVYEYMPQGSLKDHLTGKTGLARPLSWRQRLQIGVDAAKGLDYLHTGCEHQIIHRDVKSSNILLGLNLEAKLGDFGLSKVSYSSAAEPLLPNTAPTTEVVGTRGYIDPESLSSHRLTEKSDVYSFGVVLLEVVTGEPPTIPGRSDKHIMQRVSEKVGKGNIDQIVDPRMQGEYSINSVWKVIDLAMKCIALSSSERPTMAEVVMHLKDCLEIEAGRENSESSEGHDKSQSIVLEYRTATLAPQAR